MARTISIKYRGSAKASRYSIKKNASIKVDGAEAVDIFAAKSEITSMEQKGNDLVIRFADGVVTTLEGYFHCEASAQPAMAIVDSDARESLVD